MGLRILLWLLMVAAWMDEEGDAMLLSPMSFQPLPRKRLMTDNFFSGISAPSRSRGSMLPASSGIGYTGASRLGNHGDAAIETKRFQTAGATFQRPKTSDSYSGMYPGHRDGRNFGNPFNAQRERSRSSPFKDLFGTDIGSSSPGIFTPLNTQKTTGNSVGVNRLRESTPAVAGGGTRLGQSNPSHIGNHPFSSLRLSPISHVTGPLGRRQSHQNNNNHNNHDNYDNQGALVKDNNSSYHGNSNSSPFAGQTNQHQLQQQHQHQQQQQQPQQQQQKQEQEQDLFSGGNRAAAYNHENPFEKPIRRNRFPLPAVNEPITLDLAEDEQKRVQYLREKKKLPPSRNLAQNLNEESAYFTPLDPPSSSSSSSSQQNDKPFDRSNINQLSLPALPALPSETKKQDELNNNNYRTNIIYRPKQTAKKEKKKKSYSSPASYEADDGDDDDDIIQTNSDRNVDAEMSSFNGNLVDQSWKDNTSTEDFSNSQPHPSPKVVDKTEPLAASATPLKETTNIIIMEDDSVNPNLKSPSRKEQGYNGYGYEDDPRSDEDNDNDNDDALYDPPPPPPPDMIHAQQVSSHPDSKHNNGMIDKIKKSYHYQPTEDRLSYPDKIDYDNFEDTHNDDDDNDANDNNNDDDDLYHYVNDDEADTLENTPFDNDRDDNNHNHRPDAVTTREGSFEKEGTGAKKRNGRYDVTVLTDEQITKVPREEAEAEKEEKERGSRETPRKGQTSLMAPSGINPAFKRVIERTIDSGREKIVSSEKQLPTDHVGFILTDDLYDDDKSNSHVTKVSPSVVNRNTPTTASTTGIRGSPSFSPSSLLPRSDQNTPEDYETHPWSGSAESDINPQDIILSTSNTGDGAIQDDSLTHDTINAVSVSSPKEIINHPRKDAQTNYAVRIFSPHTRPNTNTQDYFQGSDNSNSNSNNAPPPAVGSGYLPWLGNVSGLPNDLGVRHPSDVVSLRGPTEGSDPFHEQQGVDGLPGHAWNQEQQQQKQQQQPQQQQQKQQQHQRQQQQQQVQQQQQQHVEDYDDSVDLNDKTRASAYYDDIIPSSDRSSPHQTDYYEGDGHVTMEAFASLDSISIPATIKGNAQRGGDDETENDNNDDIIEPERNRALVKNGQYAQQLDEREILKDERELSSRESGGADINHKIREDIKHLKENLVVGDDMIIGSSFSSPDEKERALEGGIGKERPRLGIMRESDAPMHSEETIDHYVGTNQSPIVGRVNDWKDSTTTTTSNGKNNNNNNYYSREQGEHEHINLDNVNEYLDEERREYGKAYPRKDRNGHKTISDDREGGHPAERKSMAYTDHPDTEGEVDKNGFPNFDDYESTHDTFIGKSSDSFPKNQRSSGITSTDEDTFSVDTNPASSKFDLINTGDDNVVSIRKVSKTNTFNENDPTTPRDVLPLSLLGSYSGNGIQKTKGSESPDEEISTIVVDEKVPRSRSNVNDDGTQHEGQSLSERLPKYYTGSKLAANGNSDNSTGEGEELQTLKSADTAGKSGDQKAEHKSKVKDDNDDDNDTESTDKLWSGSSNRADEKSHQKATKAETNTQVTEKQESDKHFRPVDSYKDYDFATPSDDAFSAQSAFIQSDSSPSSVFPTPFESLFGKSRKRAEQEDNSSFGSLFQNVNQDYSKNDLTGKEIFQRKGRAKGFEGGSDGSDSLFDKRLGEIVERRPSLRLFSRRKRQISL